ncbi:MliC family protein [Mycolicibacterium thermoresistibile]
MRKSLVSVRVAGCVAALVLTACSPAGPDANPDEAVPGTTPAETTAPPIAGPDGTDRASEEELAAELHRRIAAGDIVGLPPVHYRCDDDSRPLSTVFYNEFDPPAAVLTWGADEVVLFGEPMASGIRYTGDGVEYAEHHGAVTVDFRGTALSCTAR